MFNIAIEYELVRRKQSECYQVKASCYMYVALAWLMGVTTPPVVKYTNRTKKWTVGGEVLVYFTGQGIQNQGIKCTTTLLSSLISDQKCCYREIAAS